MYTNAPRSIRALRLRRRWRQETLGAHARVSRQAVSRLERGELDRVTLRTLRSVVDALGATVSVQVRWRGEELDRLVDAMHAGLQADTARRLEALGWTARAEVSFNHYGDRGRIDLLAVHRATGVVLVVEVKSSLGDLQETLGRLDVKTRLGGRVAADLRLGEATAVVPVLVIGDSLRARRIVAGHAPLFGRFSLRGRSAWGWLRRPARQAPEGLLWFAKLSDSPGVVIRRGRRAPKASDARTT